MKLVADLMTKTIVSTTPDESLAEVQAKMESGSFRRLPVLQNGELAGIITDHDVWKRWGYLAQTRVNGAMVEDVITIAPNSPVTDAVQVMLEKKISGLPVVDGGKLVGIISTSDILRDYLASSQ